MHGSTTDAQAEKAKELTVAQRGLMLATQGLGTAISEQLAGPLTPLLIDMTKWLDANRGIVATDLKAWIDGVIPEVVTFGKDANFVAGYLGGWTKALEGFGALLVGGWALKMVASLNPLVRLLILAGLRERSCRPSKIAMHRPTFRPDRRSGGMWTLKNRAII